MPPSFFLRGCRYAAGAADAKILMPRLERLLTTPDADGFRRHADTFRFADTPAEIFSPC